MQEEKEAQENELRLEEELIMFEKNRGVGEKLFKEMTQKLKDHEQQLRWIAEDIGKQILEKRDS